MRLPAGAGPTFGSGPRRRARRPWRRHSPYSVRRVEKIMSKILLRYSLRALASSVMLLVIAAIAIYTLSELRLRRTFPVRVSLGAPDTSLVARGRELAVSRGCADCHGDDFGGKLMLDEMPFGRVASTNLTPSPGEDHVRHHERMYRALHHGVDMDSRPLLLMPSVEFASLSAQEVEALSAYLGTLSRVDRDLPDSAMGPLARALLVAGKLEGFLSAETIDHGRPAVAAPPPVGTIAYGRHAAQLCTGCHRADFGGGKMSHGGPEAPPAANLTPHASGLAGWSESDFLASMQTGRRPDGSEIDGRFMPWRAVGHASDQELRSIWRFLRTLPPVQRDPRAAHEPAP
jgi:cytochrome c553